jgi:hypothetical protein
MSTQTMETRNPTRMDSTGLKQNNFQDQQKCCLRTARDCIKPAIVMKLYLVGYNEVSHCITSHNKTKLQHDVCDMGILLY